MNKSTRVHGFTLIELMITVALLSILAAIAVPSFQQILFQMRASAEVQRLATSFAFIRTEAIKRNSQVSMCPSSNGTSCDYGLIWSDGWVIFNDENSNGDIDAVDDIVLQVSEASVQGITVFSNKHKDWFGYRSNGTSIGNSGAGNASFVICSSEMGDEYGRQIIISVTGRARFVGDIAGKDCDPG